MGREHRNTQKYAPDISLVQLILRAYGRVRERAARVLCEGSGMSIVNTRIHSAHCRDH